MPQHHRQPRRRCRQLAGGIAAEAHHPNSVRDEIALLTQFDEHVPAFRNVELHMLLDDGADEVNVFVRVLLRDLLFPL